MRTPMALKAPTMALKALAIGVIRNMGVEANVEGQEEQTDITIYTRITRSSILSIVDGSNKCT
jgi:hypothetical protein